MLLGNSFRYHGAVFLESDSEVATRGVLQEKVSLEILQNSQENNCARFSFLINLQASSLKLYHKRDFSTGVFLWVFRKTFLTELLWVLLTL